MVAGSADEDEATGFMQINFFLQNLEERWRRNQIPSVFAHKNKDSTKDEPVREIRKRWTWSRGLSFSSITKG